MATSSWQAKFTGLLALYTADSGGSGLNNSASAAFVAQFIQPDDPYPKHRRPYILCQDAGSPNDGPLNAAKEFYPGTVNLHVFTDRDTDRTSAAISAIVARISAVYENATPATVTPWKFNSIRVLREFTAPATEKERHRVVQLYVAVTNGN